MYDKKLTANLPEPLSFRCNPLLPMCLSVILSPSSYQCAYLWYYPPLPTCVPICDIIPLFLPVCLSVILSPSSYLCAYLWYYPPLPTCVPICDIILLFLPVCLSVILSPFSYLCSYLWYYPPFPTCVPICDINLTNNRYIWIYQVITYNCLTLSELSAQQTYTLATT